MSAEGATQGCNLAMGFYGVGAMGLIYKLKEYQSVKSAGLLMIIPVLVRLLM